jgi:hypothetical protein
MPKICRKKMNNDVRLNTNGKLPANQHQLIDNNTKIAALDKLQQTV